MHWLPRLHAAVLPLAGEHPTVHAWVTTRMPIRGGPQVLEGPYVRIRATTEQVTAETSAQAGSTWTSQLVRPGTILHGFLSSYELSSTHAPACVEEH